MDQQRQQELEELWTRGASALLSSIDPGLPAALGLTVQPRLLDTLYSGTEATMHTANTEPEGIETGEKSSSDGQARAAGSDNQDPALTQPSTSPDEHAALRGKLGLSVLGYRKVKVQNLRTLFPDRQLRFRPLDSFKLDLVTVGTFVSIAVTKLRFDDPLTDLVAVVSSSVWFIGVYYRIQARRNEYELETSRKLVERISARKNFHLAASVRMLKPPCGGFLCGARLVAAAGSQLQQLKHEPSLGEKSEPKDSHRE